MEDRADQLTQAIARGDTAALTQFYESYFTSMYVEARRLTRRDESFCLDIVQDAMMRVIRSARRIETDAALRQWLRLIVRSAAYDRLRSESRRRQREAAYAQQRAEAADTDEPDLHEQLRWIRQQITEMEVPEARLLMLRYRFGWTLQRIGEQAGLTPGAVSRRLTRLVARLQRRAQEQCDDAD